MGQRFEDLLKYNVEHREKNACEIKDYNIIKGLTMVDGAI